MNHVGRVLGLSAHYFGFRMQQPGLKKTITDHPRPVSGFGLRSFRQKQCLWNKKSQNKKQPNGNGNGP